MSKKTREQYERVAAEDWDALHAACIGERLPLKDVMILKLYFAFMGKYSGKGSFTALCKQFFAVHRVSAGMTRPSLLQPKL